ncbi:DUF3460 family protein [Ralstonia pseudosolanacearum]
MSLYKSEITQFLEELKTSKPDLETRQRQGRSLLWDKEPVDLEERSRAQFSRVPQKPYVYSLD